MVSRPCDVKLVLLPLWGVERSPLHMAHLAAQLAHHGVRVEVDDLNLRAHRRAEAEGLAHLWVNGTDDGGQPWDIFNALWPALEPHLMRYAEELLRSDAPMLGFYLCTGNRHFVQRMVQHIRREDPGRTVVVGGPDLDRIPFPTYDHVHLPDYRGKVMPFLFSRGCIGRCAFCADRLHQPAFRCRSADHAVAELEHHQRRHGRRLFGFHDLACNGDPARLADLCGEIRARRGLEPVWSSHARVCTHLTDDLLRLMAAAGCTDLNFGVESGSDRVLRRMNKEQGTGNQEF